MKKLIVSLLFAVTVFTVNSSSAAWQEMMHDLLLAPYGQPQDSLIESIVNAAPEYRLVIDYISAFPFPPADAGKAVLKTNKCIDGVVRPYVLYVPNTYNNQTPAPLFIWLHGSVSRPDLNKAPLELFEKSPVKKMAEDNGWIALIPLGQSGATWWDKVGMTNIIAQIRLTKQEYNIDDDRVWMAGFSDGASGAFLFSMAIPSDFAAFAALNGHMGVGSIDGNQPLYAPNMRSTPIFATTTDSDQLYPTSKMKKSFDMAKAAGADILYRQLPGRHDMNDVLPIFPEIIAFLKDHPRRSFPNHLEWESAARSFGLCRWLSIEGINDHDPAAWHRDFNTVLVDSSISIGISPNEEFTGPGIAVAALANGDYLAGRIGLLPGDIILRANGIRIINLDSLNSFKNLCSRGSAVDMEVQRGQDRLQLAGNFPEPYLYFAFKREVPSAKIIADFNQGNFNIKTSRTAALKIYFHPDMIRPGQKVKINIDGRDYFDGIVNPDLRFILENFLKHRVRKLLYFNQIRITL